MPVKIIEVCLAFRVWCGCDSTYSPVTPQCCVLLVIKACDDSGRRVATKAPKDDDNILSSTSSVPTLWKARLLVLLGPRGMRRVALNDERQHGKRQLAPPLPRTIELD
jgi:hypothetical protein